MAVRLSPLVEPRVAKSSFLSFFVDDQRFPRTARLLTKAEFDSSFQSKKLVSSLCFRAHVLFLPETEAQLGLAIAKRVVPLAVHRNRLRRLIRESFRKQRSGLTGLKIVVLVKPKIREFEHSAIQLDLNLLFNRLNSLNLISHPGTMPDSI
jgi:ribonuclease P protein component